MAPFSLHFGSNYMLYRMHPIPKEQMCISFIIMSICFRPCLFYPMSLVTLQIDPLCLSRFLSKTKEKKKICFPLPLLYYSDAVESGISEKSHLILLSPSERNNMCDVPHPGAKS